MNRPVVQWLTRNSLPSLPVYNLENAKFLFIHGLASRTFDDSYTDFGGQKVTALAQSFPQEMGTFELRGHSSSPSSPTTSSDCGATSLVTIRDVASVRDWLQDCTDVLDRTRSDKVVLIGSSLGGYLAVLTALVRPERVSGLVLLCPAIDLQHASWSLTRPGARFTDQGTFLIPSNFVRTDVIEGIEVAASMMRCDPQQDGDLLLISGPASCTGPARLALLRDVPVRILHGSADDVVPVSVSEALVRQLRAAGCQDVALEVAEGGDHRLSDERNLEQLTRAVRELL